ncbi:hypothetical protein SAMN02745866_02152 [Alteromonadaceae bacterium Bs31]|nr:hypothetical protein SAMN02745866_02152 [Alteromonadaceae bacterium Bs31]
MGFGGISDWSAQYPFIDLMKQAREWKDWGKGIEGFSVDEHDWVLELKPEQTAGTVFLTPRNEDTLHFDKVIVFYEGEGTLTYAWGAKKVDEESTEGRDVVTVSANANLLNIKQVNTANPLRNIKIIPDIYLSAYEAGEIFNPDFIARATQFRAVRFMDWMNTNKSLQELWGDRPLREDRTWRVKDGVPLEVMLQLVNMLEADPWFTIPHLANDEYIRQFAELVEAQLADGLKVYVEHSNEVWNWGFPQSRYALASGKARWGDEHADAHMQWHGMRTAKICDAFKNGPFTQTKDRVKCVLGVQTAWHGLQKTAMECPLWVAEGHSPCYQHGFDYIGVTTYFSAGLNGPYSASSTNVDLEPTLRSWFSEPDGGLDKAFAQLKHGTELRKVAGYENYAGVVSEITEELSYWVNYAESFGMGIVAYEGGQHITANGLKLQEDTDFIDFHKAINRDSRMGELYTDMFNTWKNGGGELHMCFVDISFPGKYGSWGALEYLTQPSSPKWDAITAFNRNTECWWDCDN